MSGDSFEMYDGAYVLGVLSAADRALFEEHLESCDECMRAVAATRDSVVLLNLTPADRFEIGARPTAGDRGGRPASMSASTPASASVERSAALLHEHHELAFPAELLPRLLAEVRRGGRRKRLSRAAVGVAAACLLALVTVVGVGHFRTPATPAAAPGISVSNAVVAANLRITTRDTWQQVMLTCKYKASTMPAGNYRAIAVDGSGHTQVVGTWPAIPGQTASMTTPTTFRTLTTQSRIASVIIVDGTGATVAQLKL